MKKLILLFLLMLLFALSSCSTGLKPRGVEQFYTSTGVEKYYLTEIPAWANFSQPSACFRTHAIRYFDIDALMKSYSLNLFEAIQIQANFNEEYVVLKKQSKVNLTIKDEEVLFFKASDKVRSKIHFFEAPTFKQIHLIWLDEALQGPKQEERLKNFLNSSAQDNGFPVLVSACLTKDEIEAKFPNLSIKAISAEMFSIYDEKGQKTPSMHVNMATFFKPDQKIIFYRQDAKKSTDEIRGNYKLLSY